MRFEYRNYLLYKAYT